MTIRPINVAPAIFLIPYPFTKTSPPAAQWASEWSEKCSKQLSTNSAAALLEVFEAGVTRLKTALADTCTKRVQGSNASAAVTKQLRIPSLTPIHSLLHATFTCRTVPFLCSSSPLWRGAR